jgi:4-aminobutyrate aminotransferase
MRSPSPKGSRPACRSVSLATIKLLKESLIANAADVGEYLKAGLIALMDAHPLIGDVRGRGLMVGVELVRDRVTKERATEERDAVVSGSFRRGLLILGAGKNAIRFSPPLVLTREQSVLIVVTA